MHWPALEIDLETPADPECSGVDPDMNIMECQHQLHWLPVEF